jgi:hypothetical protein
VPEEARDADRDGGQRRQPGGGRQGQGDAQVVGGRSWAGQEDDDRHPGPLRGAAPVTVRFIWRRHDPDPATHAAVALLTDLYRQRH